MRLPGFAPRNGGQVHAHAAGLGVSPGLGEQPAATGQNAVLRCPHQHLDPGRLERKALVDIALAVLDHRHAGRARRYQSLRALSAQNPAMALFFREAPLFAAAALPAFALKKGVIDKAQHAAVARVHGNDGMQGQADALFVNPKRGGILNGKHMTAAAFPQVRCLAVSAISLTVTLGLCRNRVMRISPARPPGRRRVGGR